MGHRALVAVETDRDRYDVYYSHWGAADLHIKQPLQDWNAEGRNGGPPDCDLDPTWTGDDIRTITHERLDYLIHEGFFRVPRDPDDDVEAFKTLWWGRIVTDVDGYETDDHDGALVAPRWYDGEALTQHFYGHFRGYADAMKEELRAERLSREKAEQRLEHYVYGKVNRSGVGSKTNPPWIPPFSPRSRTPPGVTGRVRGLDAHDRRAGDGT